MNSHAPLLHPRDAEFLFLDLDGTLSDPSEGITGGVLYALERFGIREENRDGLRAFIGPPLYDSFMRCYGFDRPSACKAIEYFQEYYSEQGMYENVPYPGVKELLYAWQARGRKLVLATSKPEIFAVRILERFGMADAFLLMAGGDVEETRVEKSLVIDYARKKLRLSAASSAIMIGDRKFDVLGAAAHGMPTAGVLYGFGSREELTQAGAAWLAESVEELEQLTFRAAD